MTSDIERKIVVRDGKQRKSDLMNPGLGQNKMEGVSLFLSTKPS